VVVVIIAVLLAIAVPVFVGSRRKADDQSAQASLRLAMSAARVKYTRCSELYERRLVGNAESGAEPHV
jgi:type II secretory pathway pseudopilin PulG